MGSGGGERSRVSRWRKPQADMRAFEVAAGLNSDPRRSSARIKAHKGPDLRLSVDAKLFVHLIRMPECGALFIDLQRHFSACRGRHCRTRTALEDPLITHVSGFLIHAQCS